MSAPKPLRKPPWLKVRPPGGSGYGRVKGSLRGLGLHTVCEEARCPNLAECWACGTATFLIMGEICTRSCRFCAVASGDPGGQLDAGEPSRVVQAAADWGLRYAVLTSVDRDDLADGGAAHFAACVGALEARLPDLLVEVLVPDFGAHEASIRTVLQAGPEVFAHNLEVVERLQRSARDRRASYAISLDTLRQAKALAPGILTKSSLMLGLGESADEVRACLRHLRSAGVDALTLGQYLAPNRRCLPVLAYPTPERFEQWKLEAESMGFLYVASGPLVRSSYRAGEHYLRALLDARGASPG